VLILDRSGGPVRAIAGRAGAAGAAGGDIFFLDMTNATVGPADLVGVVSVGFEPIYLVPGEVPPPGSVTISNDGVRIAVATLTSTGGTSVTVRDRTEETLRTVRF